MTDPRRILVLDDTPTMRLIVTGMLEDLGFRHCLPAETAESAWKLVADQRVDLLLADWNLPGRSGVELIRKIRAQDRHQHLPIIMMTSNNDPRQIEEARASGANGYLVKPFSALDLQSRIEEAFGVHLSPPSPGKEAR